MALWKLLDYIDVYRTPLYNMMLHFIRNRVSPLYLVSSPYSSSQERVSPQPHYVGGDTKMNKSQLIQSLNSELEELRLEVMRSRRGLFLVVMSSFSSQ